MTYSSIQRLGNDHLAFNLNHKDHDYYLILLDEDIKDSVISIHDFGQEDVMMGDVVICQVDCEKDNYFDAFFDTTEREQYKILDHFFENTSSSIERVIEDWLEYTNEYLNNHK